MAKHTNSPTADTLLKKSLFWLSVIFLFFIPFIYALVLQTVILTVESNIAYKSLAPIISGATAFSSVLTSYFGLSLIACSVARFGIKDNKGAVTLALLHHPFEFLMYMMAYAFSGGSSIALATFNLGLDALINTLIYAVILAVLAIVRYSKQKKALPLSPPLPKKAIGRGGMFSYIWASMGVFAAAQLLTLLYTMISDFADPSLGLPINIQEWIYWITEYLTVTIYAVIGYFLALIACYLCEYYKKHFSEDVKPTADTEASAPIPLE